MKIKTIIKRGGEIVQEVTDREGADCRVINRVSEAMGGQVSDYEITGPDCDSVHEMESA